MSSVHSVRGRTGMITACLVLCGLFAFSAAADTVTTPIKQFGYSYGRVLTPNAALSPDGSRILISSGNDVLLIDKVTGLLLRTFSAHIDAVTAVAFSPDGTKILTGSKDQTALVWDIETGQVLCVSAQPRGEVASVAFSPDGQFIVTGTRALGLVPGQAYIWSAVTGLFIRVLDAHMSDVTSVAYSADGRYLATGSRNYFLQEQKYHGVAYVWDLETGSMAGPFQDHWGDVTSVALSPDGSRLVTGSWNDSGAGVAFIWDVTNNTRVSTLNMQAASSIVSVAFSPDGTRVATGGDNGVAVLWSALGGRILTLNDHLGDVKTVAFSPDGTELLTAAEDNYIRIWDTATGKKLRGGHTGILNTVRVSPDGETLITGSGDTTGILWNIAAATEIYSLKGHAASVNAADFSPSGDLVLTGAGDYTGKLWDTVTAENYRTFMWHFGFSVNALRYSPDGNYMLTGASDGLAKLWDTLTGVQLSLYGGHGGAVTSVDFAPDGGHVVTGSADGTAIIWDTFSAKAQPKYLLGHSSNVKSVAFSPDGTKVATGSADRTVKVWNAESGALIRTISAHDDVVNAVAFSPEGNVLLSGSADRTAKAWRLYSGTLLRTYGGHRAGVRTVAYTPDGAQVVTSSGDRTAMLWDAARLTVVPAVTGLELSAAEQLIEAGNLYANPITRVYSTTVPLDFVISQEPGADTEVMTGTPVALEVSLGAEVRTVPNVVGLDRAAAEAALADVDLVAGTVTLVYDDTAPADQVMAQNPVSDTEVPPRSAVDLTVSLGPLPAQFTVPNVVGLLQSAAVQVLEAGYLYSGAVTRVYSSVVPVDHVVAQRPAANTLAPTWSAVDLDVSRGPAPVAAPNVVGLNRIPAQVAIISAGLTVGAVTEVFDAVMPAGQVVSQNPVAGALLAPGSAVALTVSKGPQPLTVPDVVGLTQAEAQAALTGAGFNTGAVVLEYSATVPAGRVMTQNPAAGTPAAPGTAVGLTVSRGAQPVTVPNIVGQTQASANAAVIAAGLGVGSVTEQYSATVLAGRVISQSPAPGLQVPPGTPVSMAVSRGPQTIFTPNVVGRTQTNAQNLIVAAGLTVGGVSHNFSATVPEGNVISQNPAAGAPVAPGTEVDLVISRGVRPVTVPNVVGRTQASAERAVTDAGLVVGAVTEQYHNTAPKGQVIAQSPSAGTEVSRGAAVNLVVSKGRAPAGFLTVPNVVGGTQAAAQTALTGAGLGVGAVTLAFSATVPAGRIISQNPVEGVQVAPGTPVDLVVSKGPEGAQPPTLEEARRILLERFYDADRDGDRRLSFAEARAVLPALTQEIFDLLDTNSDGFVTRAELEDEGGGCNCIRNLFGGGAKKQLGDLFLAGLALSALAALGRARRS